VALTSPKLPTRCVPLKPRPVTPTRPPWQTTSLPNGAAPPPPADDYDESAEAEESADEDLIADLGTDEDLAADDMDAILHGGLDDIDNPHEDDL